MVESVNTLESSERMKQGKVIVVKNQRKGGQDLSISALLDPPILIQNTFQQLYQEQVNEEEAPSKEDLQHDTLAGNLIQSNVALSNRQIDKVSSQQPHLSDEEEVVADSLPIASTLEGDNQTDEIANQIKEDVDRGGLSPRGTPLAKKKSFKTYPPSTPVTRGRGKTNKNSQS